MATLSLDSISAEGVRQTVASEWLWVSLGGGLGLVLATVAWIAFYEAKVRILRESERAATLSFQMNQEKLAEREASLFQAQARLTELEATAASLAETKVSLTTTHQHLMEKLDALTHQVQVGDERFARLSSEHQETLTEKAMAEAELQGLKKQFADWKTNLDENWAKQFEALSLKTLNQVQESLEIKAKREFGERQELLQKDIKALVDPLEKMLKENDEQVQNQIKETLSLKEQLKFSFEQTKELKEAKDRIVSVLSDNKGRGDWGEFQLLRLLEMSGLVKDRDYFFQHVQSAETRPDVRINLPNGNILYIDVKTLVGKLDRFEEDLAACQTEEERKTRTESLKKEILKLSVRDYQNRESTSVDFVILYVPRESMLRIPLEEHPLLLDEAFQRGIILSSPLILMGLLKTVAQGWAHAKVADNAKQVIEAGKVLHKRAATFLSRFEDIEKTLEQLNKKYDSAKTAFTGSQGFVPQINRLERLGAKSTNLVPSQFQGALEASDGPLELLEGHVMDVSPEPFDLAEVLEPEQIQVS